MSRSTGMSIFQFLQGLGMGQCVLLVVTTEDIGIAQGGLDKLHHALLQLVGRVEHARIRVDDFQCSLTMPMMRCRVWLALMMLTFTDELVHQGGLAHIVGADDVDGRPGWAASAFVWDTEGRFELQRKESAHLRRPDSEMDQEQLVARRAHNPRSQVRVLPLQHRRHVREGSTGQVGPFRSA